MEFEYQQKRDDKYDWGKFFTSKTFGFLWIGSIAVMLLLMFIVAWIMG